MDKNLHDDIDDFFSNGLRHYAEEPGKNIWFEIDKRLTENQRSRQKISRPSMLITAVIIICLLMPYLLIDPHFNFHKLAEKESINKKITEPAIVEAHITGDTSAYMKIIHNGNANTKQNNLNTISIYKPRSRDVSIIKTSLYKAVLNKENEQQLKNLNNLIFADDNMMIKNKAAANQATSATVKLSKKNYISINPFFSADHISGRFIEQYEFDNEDKNDYQRREKPDFSFTAGILAQYNINKKLSAVSGLSVSNATLSISSTAVNALKDESGTYKFKLATSYGLAEISKSGITPGPGDSLLVSDASLNFKYISFPLLMNYNFNTKKIKLSAHGGVALNKIMSDKVDVDYQVQNNDEIETVNKIEGIKKTFFTVNAGLEASYPLSRNIGVSVSPEIRYGINSINKGTPVKTYPVNYGLGFHLNIKL